MNIYVNAIDTLPLAEYNIIWLLIGTGLLVLAILFVALVLLFTKKLNPEDFVKPLDKEVTGAERLSLIKNTYTEELLKIEQQWNDKEISTRKAFQLLSLNLRNFTHEYSSSGAFSFSLQDLEEHNAPEILVNKIRNYYPLSFEEANRTGNVNLAVQDALKLIQVWN